MGDPILSVTALTAFFREAPTVAVKRTVYRRCLSIYRESLVSMRGAFAHGARYNVKQYFGCLYTCLDPETLDAELRRYFTVPPDLGFVDAQIEVRLSRVVDLTNELIHKKAGFKRGALVANDYLVTRHAGLCAWQAGIEAMLVPSAAMDGKTNLAVFLDNQSVDWQIGLRSVIFA